MGKTNSKKIEIIPGLILILIGTMLLLDSFNILTFNPIYLMTIIGVLFIISYFTIHKGVTISLKNG